MMMIKISDSKKMLLVVWYRIVNTGKTQDTPLNSWCYKVNKIREQRLGCVMSCCENRKNTRHALQQGEQNQRTCFGSCNVLWTQEKHGTCSGICDVKGWRDHRTCCGLCERENTEHGGESVVLFYKVDGIAGQVLGCAMSYRGVNIQNTCLALELDGITGQCSKLCHASKHKVDM